ncbi:MAG: YggT family protein [Parvibaculaceae bacterium]
MIALFFSLLFTVCQLYMYVVIVNIVLSWLIAFNVVNTQNRFVYTVMDVTYRLTEPALAPIRRFMPDLGGIDLSPVVLFLALIYIPQFLYQIVLSLTNTGM